MKPIIVQFLPELNVGGVERGTIEIARAIVAEGFRSVVVSNGGRLVEQLLNEGSEHISLPIHKKALASLRLIKKLKPILEEADIAHVRSRMPAWLVSLALKSIKPGKRPKLVSTAHGLYSVNPYSRIMTKGDALIAISKTVEHHLIKNYGEGLRDKIKIIHRGVDSDEFPFDYSPTESWRQTWFSDNPQFEGKDLLCFPARITRWKGQTEFINLMTKLSNLNTNCHGLIVGGASGRNIRFETELRDHANKSGIQNRITFLGSRADVREIMSVSKIVFNLSSHPEPFGRTMIEAMSLGIPVIAWNYGGAAESLAAQFPSGLVDPHNFEKLVETTLQVLRDPKTRPTKNVFPLTDMQRKTLDIYKKLVATS